MSSEIMMKKNDKIVGYDVDAFQAMVETWAPRMQSGSELFTPVLSNEQRKTLNDIIDPQDDKNQAGLFALATTASTTLIPGFMIDFSALPDTPRMLLGFGIVLGSMVSSLGAGVGTFKFLRRNKEKQAGQVKQFLKIADELDVSGLTQWLKRRYDLSIDKQPADVMVKHMYQTGKKSKESIEFVDSNKPGRLWSLKYDHNKLAWLVEEVDVNKSGQTLSLSAVQQTEPVNIFEMKPASLSGECAVLLESFYARQEKLRPLKLSTESQHVALRCNEDLRQALALHYKLVHVGKAELADLRLGEALSLLNDELNMLLEQEIQTLDSEFQVQNTYLKSRQLVSDSALVLPASVDGAEYENDRVR